MKESHDINLYKQHLLFAISASIFIILLTRFAFVRLLHSPLSKIPGPSFAALSSLPLDGRYFLEKGCSYIEDLHRKYGPVVRVGPSEVVFNDLTSLRAIYGIRSNIPKPDFVGLFDNYGYPCSFSSIQREQHRERRRFTNKIYTMSAVMDNSVLMDYIHSQLHKFTGHIDRQLGKPTDVFQLAIYFALDNITFMVLNEDLGLLDGRNPHIPEITQSSSVIAVPFVRFPVLCGITSTWLFRYLLPKDLCTAFERLGKHGGLSSCIGQLMEIDTNANDLDKSNASTIWHMRSQSEFGGQTLTEGHVRSECLDHINAGVDTTGATVTFFFRTLALPENKTYQDQLRQEIRSLPTSHSLKDVCNLPFLNNCCYEVLRLFAPGPGSLQQRQIPFREKPTTIPFDKGSVELPAGTLVGVQPYSLHRNRTIFGEDALEFRPERWTAGDADKLKMMKEAWIPFGFGARSCIGINVAMVEIKAIVATIFEQYHVSLPPNIRKEDTEPILAGVIRPKSGKCHLIFEKLG